MSCHVGHAAGDRTPLRTAEASVAATDRSLSLASQRWDGDGASSLRISPQAARGAPPSADKAGVPLTARTRDRCTGRDCSQHLLWLQRCESVCFRKDPGPTGRKATTGGGATASGLMRGRPLRPVTPHHGCHHFSGGPRAAPVRTFLSDTRICWFRKMGYFPSENPRVLPCCASSCPHTFLSVRKP